MSGKLAAQNPSATVPDGRDGSTMAICPSKPGLPWYPLSDDYRGKAAACAELAAKTEDPPSKRVMERSAEQWNALADSVEKYELTRK